MKKNIPETCRITWPPDLRCAVLVIRQYLETLFRLKYYAGYALRIRRA